MSRRAIVTIDSINDDWSVLTCEVVQRGEVIERDETEIPAAQVERLLEIAERRGIRFGDVIEETAVKSLIATGCRVATPRLPR